MKSVTIYNMKTTRIKKELFDTFCFRQDKNFHFIQKIALKLLSKLGCTASVFDEKYSRIEIDSEDFMRSFMAQYKTVLENTHYDPKMVYMGPKDFEKFARVSWGDGVNLKEMNIPIELRNNGQKYIIGLRIIIVPWMDGVLIAPKG